MWGIKNGPCPEHYISLSCGENPPRPVSKKQRNAPSSDPSSASSSCSGVAGGRRKERSAKKMIKSLGKRSLLRISSTSSFTAPRGCTPRPVLRRGPRLLRLTRKRVNPTGGTFVVIAMLVDRTRPNKRHSPSLQNGKRRIASANASRLESHYEDVGILQNMERWAADVRN